MDDVPTRQRTKRGHHQAHGVIVYSRSLQRREINHQLPSGRAYASEATHTTGMVKILVCLNQHGTSVAWFQIKTPTPTAEQSPSNAPRHPNSCPLSGRRTEGRRAPDKQFCFGTSSNLEPGLFPAPNNLRNPRLGPQFAGVTGDLQYPLHSRKYLRPGKNVNVVMDRNPYACLPNKLGERKSMYSQRARWRAKTTLPLHPAQICRICREAKNKKRGSRQPSIQPRLQ